MSLDETVRPSPDLETVRLPVSGMTCGSCVSHITRALKRIDGVSAVSVDLRSETATVTRERALVTVEAIASAIDGAGYSADLGGATVLPASASALAPARRSLLARLFGA